MKQYSMTTLIPCAAVLAACFWTSPVSAYCIGGNTCPSASTDMDVYSICNNTSTAAWASCTGTLAMSTSQTITIGRIYATFWDGSSVQSGYIPIACIGGTTAHALRHSSFHVGGMVQSSSQARDVAMCFGAGDDDAQLWSFGTCGSIPMVGWNYGSGGHWMELWGQTGDDTLVGANGNDRLCGGSDDDHLTGASGADDVDGDYGDDWVNPYDSAGDLGWGYYGNDIVADAGGGTSDAVYGEFGADDCVMVDEATSGDTGIIVNGGTANCVAGTCSCGTSADDSCVDQSKTPLYTPIGTSVGIEYYYSAHCPVF